MFQATANVQGIHLLQRKYFLQLNPTKDPVKFLFDISYSLAITTELCIPTYYGSWLRMKSENLSYEIFKSNWIDKTNDVKKTMMLFVEGTLRSINMQAGRIFALDLITTLKVTGICRYVHTTRLPISSLLFIF